MAEWTIYDKNGEERTVAQGVSTVSAKHYVQPDLEYSGTWMGDCFVTLNLRSAYPINFQIGDYVVYRGEKFVMNYDPSVVKKARRGTYGEGFTYDNVKFNALSYELTDMRMLDYVLYDNSVHYSSLPKFSFFCSDVDDLADRLQVNANRYCDDNNITGSDRWIFITPSALRTQQRAEASHFPTADADTIYNFYFPTLPGDYEKVNQNVSIDNMTVWNACKYIKDTFGLNFIVRGRYVVIGAEGIPTEHFFRYGKGNGLYEIERHADEDQAVITKLYAYGSDKNLPTRYYANLNVTCGGTVTTVAKGGLTYNKLDIPYSASFFKTKTEVNDVECYAVRLTYNGTTYDAYVGSADVLEGVEPDTTNCSIVFTDGQNIPFGATNTVTFVGGINKDAWPVDHRTQQSGYALPNNMAVGNLMLPGFPTNSLKAWVLSNGGVQNSDGTVTWRGHTAYFSEDQYQPYILSRNADVLGIRESTKFFDGSDGDDEIYPTIEGMTGADSIVSAETIADNGIFGEGAEVPNFTITLPDFGSGFDLKELLQSDTAIEMKNGFCGGRKFTVKSVTRNADRTWACKCEREHDTALDLWFPYSYGMSIGNASAIADEPYQVQAGDKYVLTGIEMTDTYVEANAAVLLEAALAFLDKNDYVRYTYVPKIDELFMARQHDGWSRGETSTYGQRSYYLTLKEGDTLLFEDNDLLINGAVYIDTLRIKEYGNGQIPTYEVTLRNDKQVGTVERMQEQINILNNTVVNGTGGGGGVNVSLVRQLIQTYGAQSFLSKLVDDIANGLITFLKGARFGRFVTGQLAGTGAQIDSRGKIEAQALTLREYLEVPELRFNRAEIIAGNTTQTPCGGIIDTVTVITEGDAETAGTGSATLKLEDGEIGKIAVGDLCMGYWHDMSGDNSETDSDDRHGRMAFSGFKTVYFRITSIPDYDPSGKSNLDKHYFEYTLRPQGDDSAFAGGNGIHPFPMMHFAGRGNSDNEKPERQGFTIHTPNYTARLSGVNTWEFTNANYTYVNGDLNGFGGLIGNPVLSGFGTIDMNLYMKGHIIQVDNTPDELSVSQSMMGLLNKFDTQIVTFKVMDGYRQDHTSLYNYRVSRSSGNPTADAMWASSHGNVGSSWTMSYADLGDADLCEFTVEATATDMPMLSATFLARKNNNLRYFLTLNTDLIHIDMNGDVIGNGDEPTMTTGNDDGGESYLQLNGNYLTTGNSDNVYKIIARAWRVGASNTVIAESIDGLTIRATKYTGSVSESGGTSDSGRLDLDVDFSCDKYIIELIDKNAVGVVYDVKTVLIVRDGSASVVADFDDEMGAGAATSDGTMLAGIPYTSVAHLYRGSAVQDLTNVELVNVNGVEITNPMPSGWGYEETTEEGVTTKLFTYQENGVVIMQLSLAYAVGGQDATLKLISLHKNARDNNRFGVRLTAGSEANTAYFYFNKFKAGSDGHVTLFQLAPDTTAIKINKNGQYSTSTVTVGVLKIDVDETGQTETSLSYYDFGALGLSVYHKVDGQPSGWSDYEGSISVGSATTSVELKLEQTKDGETIEWDTETIPVVKDGLDSSYIMKFAESNYEPTAENIRDYYYDNFAEGRNWAIMSSDGGEHWNGPYPIIGEEGAPGGYTEFSFGISNVSITNSATTPPSDIGVNDWHDGIISVTESKPYLWMRQGTFTWNGSTFVIDSNGYTYARVKGLDAPDRYELEVSDTTFQIGQDDTTYTPSEIYVRGVVVKADGTRTYLVNNDWRNTQTAKNPVTTTITVTLSDDTTASYTYNDDELIPTSALNSGRVKINALLSTENIDIADVKSISMKCDFKKNNTTVGSVATTFNVVRNGRDGAIVVQADLDDEMISIPVKSDGSAESFTWTTYARLYKGTEPLPLRSAEASDYVGKVEGVSTRCISGNDPRAQITITNFDNKNTDNIKIPITLTATTGEIGTCIAYINKIPSGEGSDAVYYNLVLSENAVHTTAQNAVTSSQTITINAYKHVGDETPVLASDNTIIQVYGSNNAQTHIGSSTSGAYTLNVASPNTLSNYKVYLNLYDPNGGTIGLLLDQETIPVLRDGEKGDDGDSIALEYSPNGTSNWNSTFRAGTDLYAREYKLDANGNRITGSEGAAFRIVGEQGIQGPDGKPGDYTDYSFGRSAQSTTADSSTAPEIDGSWNDGVPVPSTAYPYIWMRKRLMTWNATRSQYVEVANTARYIRVTGEKGDKGEDGKDAAAYEFVRFSDDATLVDGVWTGTFTAAVASKVTEKETAQGDTKNLILYSEFGLWDYVNGKPVGWSKNNGVETFSRGEDGWVSFDTPGGQHFNGLALSVEPDENGPKYLVPYTYDSNRTRTISVKYYGSGQVMIGVHYLRWDGSNKTLTQTANYQEWQYYGEEITDGKEHLLTFTFDIREPNATHLRLFFVHRTRTGEETKTYSYHFSQPKIEVGSTATAYLPSPREDLLGTTQGLWKGTLRWSHPYASSDFSLYEWTKVRDAEPRMGTWGEGNCTHVVRTDLPEEDKYFYCGAYGEPYYDIAYYKENDVYWMCKKTYRRDLKINVVEDGETVQKSITPADENLWTMYWERASQFNFLMAKTLYAIDAFIENLVVSKLATLSSDGSAYLTIENGMIVIESLGDGDKTSIKFGVNGANEAVLQYFQNGVMLYDLGPNGITDNIEQVDDSYTAYVYISMGSSLDNVSQIKLNTTGIAHATYYQFSEGYKRNGNVIEYNVSKNSTPSQYDGKVFTGKGYTSSTIPDGWYRKAHDNDSDYFMVMTTTGNNVYYCQMFYYEGGKLMITRDYCFTKSNGYGIRCDRSGNPI